MKFIIICVLLLLSGCAYTGYFSSSVDQNVKQLSEQCIEYPITFASVYDLYGYSDTYIKVSCPIPLSFVIEGSQPDIVKKQAAPIIEKEACCLPF
jgi:hypothetical protein